MSIPLNRGFWRCAFGFHHWTGWAGEYKKDIRFSFRGVDMPDARRQSWVELRQCLRCRRYQDRLEMVEHRHL